MPPAPGLPGSENVRAAYSTYEWRAISSLASQGVLVLEVETQESDDGDWRTQPFDNRETSSVGTTMSVIARANANRTALYVVNVGTVPLFLRPNVSPTTSLGVVLQAGGGFLSVKGNSIEVVSPASGRAAPLDRNPLKIQFGANKVFGSSTQADTQDVSYTVPAGRKCDMDIAFCQAVEDSTTALNGAVECYIRYQKSGGSPFRIASAFLSTGVASAQSSVSVPKAITMLAGDLIEGKSLCNNNAGGSSASGVESFVGTEYDV